MNEAASPRIRKTMVFVLLALFLGQFGSGVYDLIFSNFLRDAQHLDVEMRGLIEFPRELPGILSFFVVSLLFMFNEVRMAGVACLLMFGGMYALAFCGAGTSLWTLSAWILTVSLGQHILMGMIDTIVIHTARPENRSLRLGQMKALGTAAALLGALCVWIKWKFNQSFAVDFFVTGGVCLLASLFLSRVKTPVFPQRRGWRQCFVFKRRYAVYYGLEILHGIRKQLYLTFGFWLMVSTLGQSPGYIGKTLLMAGVIGLVTQPLIGWSIKRYGERKVTIFDSVALSLLCLAYAFAPELLPLHWAVGVVTACFVLDNLLFALGMARSTYVARICEKPEDITPSIYTGLAINHVASIAYGVLGGVISALNCVCSKGDKILIHSPTYIGFTMSLKNNGYEAVHSPLVKDENGVWRMDFEDMEKHLKEEKIHAAIMCNPHNPCGRVWERWELEKAMELYKKYDVYVVSDEIWSDIILSGNKHIPTQSVSEDARQRTAAFYAPSKTFNLAGLVGSYHIVYNSWWRDRMEKESSLSHYNMMNVLSMHALIGAYKPEGYEWTDELCEVLTGNIDFACDYIEKHFEGVTVSKPQGTYMLFVDCTDWCKAHGKTIEDVEHACWDVGAAIQDGTMFFGPCHLRMNLASPRSRIEEAFHRMDKYVFNA